METTYPTNGKLQKEMKSGKQGKCKHTKNKMNLKYLSNEKHCPSKNIKKGRFWRETFGYKSAEEKERYRRHEEMPTKG